MRLSARVARLAAAPTLSSGCDACRDWSPRLFLHDGEAPRPERCPACGRQVPLRLVRIYDVAWDPAQPLPDVLAVAAEGVAELICLPPVFPGKTADKPDREAGSRSRLAMTRAPRPRQKR